MKDILITFLVKLSVKAFKDREDEYNETVRHIETHIESSLKDLGYDCSVEVFSEEGTEDLYLTD